MPHTDAGVVNITEVIDRSRIGVFQIGTFAVCALCLLMDGFDIQAMGYVLPALSQEWGVSLASLGGVLAAGNFGVLIGALVFTIVGDTLGRRPALIGATVFFGLFTLLTARAASVEQLLLFRFIAGIGLGSIMPNSTALIGEYSPRRKRVALMMGITVGFTAGGAVAGFVAAWLIPVFGWRSVFYAGGAIPLVIGAVMFALLPESLHLLVLRGRDRDRLIRGLRRIDPDVASGPETEFVIHEQDHAGVPVLHLFRDRRGWVTIMFWMINFLNITNLYALSGWLTTVIRGAGYSTRTSVLVGTTLQIGGTMGAFGIAWLIGRRGFIPVLTCCFAIACLSIVGIGQVIGRGFGLPLLAILVFLAGWCVVGGQPGLNALAATYYPTSLRSTGVGWALGIGRIGGILGPALGGILLARDWTTPALFIAAGVPALVSALLMFTLRWMMAAPITRGEHQVAPH